MSHPDPLGEISTLNYVVETDVGRCGFAVTSNDAVGMPAVVIRGASVTNSGAPTSAAIPAVVVRGVATPVLVFTAVGGDEHVARHPGGPVAAGADGVACTCTTDELPDEVWQGGAAQHLR